MNKKRMFIVTIVCLGILILAINIKAFDKVKANNSYSNGKEINTQLENEYTELLEKGYTKEDLSFIEISNQIVDLKEDSIENEEIIEIIDRQSEENKVNVIRGNFLENAYDVWDGLTFDEKSLVAQNPVKAIAAFASSKKTAEITKQIFGKNGLGDKSDGFRHATWCALMARDAGAKFAKDFSNAHESGKTEEFLQQNASDGYKEADHREMDLHNNGVGISLITDKNVENEEVINMVTAKLTNNKQTGIYWLHD